MQKLRLYYTDSLFTFMQWKKAASSTSVTGGKPKKGLRLSALTDEKPNDGIHWAPLQKTYACALMESADQHFDMTH